MCVVLIQKQLFHKLKLKFNENSWLTFDLEVPNNQGIVDCLKS